MSGIEESYNVPPGDLTTDIAGSIFAHQETDEHGNLVLDASGRPKMIQPDPLAGLQGAFGEKYAVTALVAGEPTVLIRDIDKIAQIYRAPRDVLGPDLHGSLKELIAQSILVAGPSHTEQKRAIVGATQAHLPYAAAALSAILDRNTAQLGMSGEVIPLVPVVKRIAFANIFGQVFGAATDAEINYLQAKWHKFTVGLFSEPGSDLQEKAAEIKTELEAFIAPKIQERITNPGAYHDTLSALVEAAKKGNWPEQRILDEAITLVVGGQSTVSAVTSAYLLEAYMPGNGHFLDEVRGERARYPEAELLEDLSKIKIPNKVVPLLQQHWRYTVAGAYNTVVTRQPSMFIQRRALQLFTFEDGVQIPPGYNVAICLTAALLDQSGVDGNPAFNPERYMVEQGRPSQAKLAYGNNQWACPGADLSIVIASMTAGRFIERYNVTVAPENQRFTRGLAGSLPVNQMPALVTPR